MSWWLNLNVNCSILGDGGSERRGRETIHSSLSDTADSLCYNDCSENGHCEKGEFRTKGSLIFKPEFFTLFFSGKCKCRKNFYGSDCSVTLDENHSTVPRVSSLANYGMCDVRKQPCKDVVVLGENFVDHPSLICIYETYKVLDSRYKLINMFLRIPDFLGIYIPKLRAKQNC